MMYSRRAHRCVPPLDKADGISGMESHCAVLDVMSMFAPDKPRYTRSPRGKHRHEESRVP